MHKVYKHPRSVPEQDLPENKIELAKFMTYVYLWLAAMLLITALSMHWFASDYSLMRYYLEFENGHVSGFTTNGLVFLFIAPAIMLLMIFLATWKTSLYWIIPMILLYSFSVALFLAVISSRLGANVSFPLFTMTIFMFVIMALIGLGTQKEFREFLPNLFMLTGALIGTYIYYYFVESRFLFRVASYLSIILFSFFVEINRNDLKRTESGIKYGNKPVYHLALLGAFNIWLDFIGMAFIMLSVRYSKKAVRRDV
ncbi:MAG TPA: Bax inhibitor-1 family protein [Bacteroidia bacterium]|nr:Bax inhibitor-1 family protein [Bacteroidia bacterium]